MAHLLYRPHIRSATAVVTTDFVIRHVMVFTGEDRRCTLPVDLVQCSVGLTARRDATLVAPMAFVFVGDHNHYAAPALALLDAGLHALDAGLAWRNARISLSRQAIALVGQPMLSAAFLGEQVAALPIVGLRGAGRQRAAIYRCSDPRRLATLSSAHMAISAGASAEHRLFLETLEPEQAA